MRPRGDMRSLGQCDRTSFRVLRDYVLLRSERRGIGAIIGQRANRDGRLGSRVERGRAVTVV